MYLIKQLCRFLWSLLLGIQISQAQVPNQRPRFVDNEYVTTFNEEQPIGSKVIQVFAVDNEGDQISFEIGADAEGKFSVEQFNGWITSNVVIDREALSDSSIRFTVYAYDSENGPENKVPVSVRVEIEDVNDNVPIFVNTPYATSINENAPLGSDVFTVSATDLDESRNGLVIYTIEQGNADGKFAIGSHLGTVVVIDSLDYESVNNYTLTILAKDNGPNNVHKTSTTLNILIDDADDLPAEFTPPSYAASVQENAAKGTEVIMVTARDRDKALNAPVEYFIDPVTNPGDAFMIVSSSGLITVNGSLNREIRDSYSLRAAAISTKHSAVYATVSITIDDVNDNAPSFVGAPYKGTIVENSSPGTTVLRVTAVDADQGTNSEFTYHLERADGKFTVTPAGYILVDDSIDRETEDIHAFEVIVRETHTYERFQAVASVTLDVTDQNDNNPQCVQALYRKTIFENGVENNLVVQVSAVDHDLGTNGEVRYSLVPDSNEYYKLFTIDASNGMIHTTASFDREVLEIYTINVRATDQPSSGHGRFGECGVEVTIGDENDNKPIFTNLPIKTGVSEGASINTVFFSVKAVDIDDGVNAAVSYSISSVNIGNAFSLDLNSGRLSTARNLDRETIAQYTLEITATDGGGKFATSSLLVLVGDINDNAPAFSESGGYHFAVDEGKAGLRVGVVTAVDQDESFNAEVIYSLKSVDDFLKFSIDTSSGEIKTATALDRETSERHSIRVLARDKELPSRETEVSVMIDVVDINDHRPAFSQRHYIVAVREQQPAHVIMNLTATDADIGVNAAFFFSVLSGNADRKFSVDSFSGELSSVTPLDREDHDSYILIVRVSDLYGNHSYGLVFDDTAVVEVIVEDINDHRPLFTESLYSVEINETISIGSAILLLSALDPDRDLNVRYSIVSGNNLERFFIDAYSGVVYIKSAIDRDPPNNETSFLLTVMAKDRGQRSLNSTTMVSVTVIDVNDSPPEFDLAAYKVTIDEDVTVGTVVLRPVCIDRDSSSNGHISFTISGGVDQNFPQFTVDSATGVVSVYREFDYDDGPKEYVLVLTATDNGHPPLSGNATVLVELQNINDNTPSFNKQKFLFVVREGSYVGNEKILGQVSATDKDRDDRSSVYGQIIYTFVNQSGFYREHHWPLDEEEGAVVFDESGSVHGLLKHGAHIVSDPHLGKVVSLEAESEAWIELGDFSGDCISDPTLCDEGLTVAFWLKFITGQYIISSGGRSGFAAGFDFYHDSHDNGFVLILATLRRQWKLKLSSIPKEWFYATFTWDSDTGLRYFQDGHRVASNEEWSDLSRANDVFTKLAVGKPNSDNINSPEYYSSLLVSDLLIWRRRLTDEEVAHSYRISRHVTGKKMPTKPPYAGSFTLSTDGVLTAYGALDRETQSMYRLDIRASDLDPVHPRFNSTVVEVEILDINDNPPVFKNASYTLDVMEHSAVGSVVLRIEAVDADEGQNSRISYSIVSGNLQNVFSIEKDSGELKVAKDIDRETFHQFVLGVQGRDGGAPSLQNTVQVIVNIADVNDNSPVVTTSSYIEEVKENLPSGLSVMKFVVADADHRANGQVTLTVSSDTFAVNTSTGVLYTTQPLDRETQDRYQLTVKATDGGGDTVKITSVSVEVVVEDENDNSPQFTQSVYRVAISENATIGTSIIRVSASDLDHGSNADIAFFLTGGDGVFSINGTSGEINIMSHIDREAEPNGFSLTVTAKDHGYPMFKSSSALVNITVSDVNDNAPQFDKFTYSAEVNEDSQIDTVVTVVHAVDIDDGLAGQIVYAITGGNGDGAFVIDSSGNIKTAKKLDRETMNAYELTVTALDQAGDPKTASVEVDINVADANDNPPYFGSIPPHILISESALPGTPVFTLIADDPDVGINKALKYAGYSAEEKFEINWKTGVISTIGNLDFEEQQRYTFLVVAMDQGTPQLNSTTLQLNITVADENDNNPNFEQAMYRVEIWENDDVGTQVVQVKATEKDSTPESQIGYNISAGNPQAHFKISFYSGTIVVQKPLDRELVPNYTLRITATDNGNPPRYGETSVTILVRDVNDRPPLFQFHDYQSEIPEDTAVGSKVTVLVATDEDSAENTELKYSIVSGDSDRHLNISTVKSGDKHQGIITVAKPLDRETKGLYRLDISVSDGLHSSNMTLEIRLTDVNDRDPEFNSSIQYTAHVAENSPGGLLVLPVSATDQDLGSNAVMTYSLQGSDNKFTIDANTGEIKTSPEPLDRESKAVYHMTVVATDIGSRQGVKDVVVHVTDVNDNAPVFSPSHVTASVTEGPGTRGKVVIQVNATDVDEENNQLITYTIIDGNLGDAFKIDSSKGVISTTADLDREAPGLPADKDGRGVYTLTVKAADQGTPVQSGTTTVHVLVTDVNDNQPVFPPFGYRVNISEGARANSDVIAAKATDLDSGSNSKLTYELISGNAGGDFSLDSETAMIRTAKKLERQLTFSYTLVIGASDEGKPPLSSTTRVRIVVGDINDNDPVFDPVNYTVSVYENSLVGTPLINVTATDADSDQNAKIMYSVTAGDPHSLFTVITKDTYGTLQIERPVDREQQNNYTLTVTAADGGVPLSRKDFATVFVTILDRNDNSPRFSKALYHGNIRENTVSGSIVNMDQEIKATDIDQGINAEVRYHLNGSERHQFSIDPIAGVITVRSFPPPSLDHEQIRSYSFHVVAVDEQGSGHASFASVKIQVLDANDNIPRFVPVSQNVTISEDSPDGFPVTTVVAVDPDSELNGKLSFSLLAGADGKFEVGRTDGVVRVVGALDREMKAHYALNVSALDGSYYPLEGFGTVFINLQDVNDNPPMFEQQVYTVTTPEDAPVGTYLVNLTAKDPDHAINAVITYSMEHPVFTIHSRSGSVVTLGELDRESQDTYSFSVFARDGGGLESNVLVNVVVTDANDNSPYFLNSGYKTDVLEKSPVDTIVLIVVAHDKDIKENGRIVYSIIESKEDLFRIDPSRGFIRVNKSINRIDLLQRGVIDADGSFTFKVIARDNGPAPRSSDVTVVMNIVDAGDDSPMFSRSSYSVDVMENQPAGMSVFEVTVVKQRPGSSVMYSIVSAQKEFQINSHTGVISTLVQLDREVQDYYVFTVQATDNGQTPLSGYTSVVVDVTDDNDHAPQFQFLAPHKMTVMEDAPLGTAVGNVQAVDNDIGQNAVFEYAITHANIGPGQRVIPVQTECDTPLGLESGDVRASDMTASSSYTVPNEDYSPTQGRLNNQRFHQVGTFYQGAWCADANNKQQFLQIDFRGMRKVTRVATQGRPGSLDYVKSFSLSFSLDGIAFDFHRMVLPGNSNGDLVRINRVLPPFHARFVRVHPQTWNGRICLRIELYGCESTGKDEVTLPFIINPDTGYVNTSNKLDREQQQSYILTVQAKDRGVPPKNSSTRLEIKITDTNDNPPMFAYHMYNASIPENAFGGYQVTWMSATDLDEGSNAVVSYAIVEGGDGKFIIEALSGIVRPSQRLDYEALLDKFYVLNISASDSGHPQFTSFVGLNISVIDFNDNQPTFTQETFNLGVSEDTMVTTFFEQVSATDEDSGDNAQITYSMTDELGMFSIERDTGRIKLLRALDREIREHYQVTVTATDNGDHKLSSAVKVNIQVLDVNDNSPVFTRHVYARKLAESVSMGTVVEVVRANDADIGNNGEVSYSISVGNDEEVFTIHEVTGAITVVKPLDREANDILKISVRAEDHGDPRRSDQAVVEFVLTDVNDNAPVIHPQKSTASVFENLDRGAFVYDVNATDDDVKSNGQVEYVIMHGGEGKFVINSTSGVITTDGALDRERKNFYTLIVMARDRGAVPYMDFGTVDVTVLDRNDKIPVFISAVGPFFVAENELMNTTVGEVSAEDEDIGINAEITYSISGGDRENMFTVDDRTGIIYTNKPLDRENYGHYDLVISATNLASSPSLSSRTTVSIIVLDKNDDVPRFLVAGYNRTISEAAKPGTSIVTVSAEDKDLGTNGRVLYRVLYDDVNINIFSINQETGVMILQNHIDDEEYRQLTVIVEAKDLGSPQSLASAIPVYVTIDDVNDNQPIFDKLGYSVSLSELSPVGRSFMEIRATDEDSGSNADITYKLLSGNNLGDFRVDNAGVVYVNLSLDRERVATYFILAGAYNYESKAFNQTRRPRKGNVDDDGYLYDTTTITINLIDVNDNAPEFIRPLFTGGIAESADLETFVIKIEATDKDVGNFSSVQYRLVSGNDGGFFKMDETSGVVTSASHFDGKKGQRFIIKVSAFDNHGRVPTNEAKEEATVQIFVLLDEQRVTLTAEVDPSLIERNKEEFISVLNNITEADVYIEAIFKVFTEDKDGDQTTNSEVVFHAVNVETQTILTSHDVMSAIEKYADQLETLYARWKIKAPVSSTKQALVDEGGLGNAELALIILASVVALLLLLGLCFTIKTRCRAKKRNMHGSPKRRRKNGEINRHGSWSHYDDVITAIERKGVAPVRMRSCPGMSYGQDAEQNIYNSKYTLTSKGHFTEDRIWDDHDYYLFQDSKVGSYLDDDGESDHGGLASETSEASSVHFSKMEPDGMVVTKV